MKKILRVGMISALLVMLFATSALAEEVTVKVGVAAENTITFDTATGTVVEANKDIVSATIPDEIEGVKVVAIGERAFNYCTDMKTITLPSTLETIDEYAFNCCFGLESIVIPKGVTYIDRYAFNDCYKLESAIIPNTVTELGEGAFNDSHLVSIDIPNSITEIPLLCFTGCSALESVTIPNSVTKIGDYAFEKCDSLDNFIIPNSVTSIGKCAFNSCDELSSITIPSSVEYLGENAFQWCTGLETLVIEEGLTYINKMAFYCCTSLKTINIANSVERIYDYGFKYCPELTSISLSDNLKSIGNMAFDQCKALETITIPNSVESIASDAFSLCAKINIHCEAGSTAEAYAKEIDLPYTIVADASKGASSSKPEPEVVPAGNQTALSSPAKVRVNGVPVSFNAYNINGNNYFKLRDLAYVLSGSNKQFEITWNGALNAIGLISGQSYTTDGSEMKSGDGKNKVGIPTTSAIYKDGSAVKFTAYNIDGNNYFKLRDVCQSFNIGLAWDATSQTISIITANSYTD